MSFKFPGFAKCSPVKEICLAEVKKKIFHFRGI